MKARLSLALVAGSLLVLTACGGGGTASSGDGSTPATSDSGASAAASAATEATPINFALNWVPGPQHEEFIAAKYNGYFDAEGLDVNMHPPASTTDPIKLVASGEDQFGVAYAGDVIAAAAQGVPIEAVATIHRSTPLGLLSAPDSGITTPQDLIGKTIGLTPVPNNQAMFYDFLEKNGIAKDQVTVVPVNFDGPQGVAAGTIDAADSVSWYENGVYEQLTGEKPNFLSFTENGVPDGYFFTIITAKDYAAQNPEIVKKFVKAVLEGTKFVLDNPAEANALLVENVPDVSLEFAQGSREILADVLVDADVEKNGLGWSNPAVWKTMAEWFEAEGLITTAVDPESLYSNDFLPAPPIMP